MLGTALAEANLRFFSLHPGLAASVELPLNAAENVDELAARGPDQHDASMELPLNAAENSLAVSGRRIRVYKLQWNCR